VPGIDAPFVGPADLAGSLGWPVGSTHTHLIDALKRVVAARRSVGRCVGIDAVSNESLEAYAEMDYRLFTFGADAGYPNEGARATAEFASGVEQKVKPILASATRNTLSKRAKAGLDSTLYARQDSAG